MDVTIADLTLIVNFPLCSGHKQNCAGESINSSSMVSQGVTELIRVDEGPTNEREVGRLSRKYLPYSKTLRRHRCDYFTRHEARDRCSRYM